MKQGDLVILKPKIAEGEPTVEETVDPNTNISYYSLPALNNFNAKLYSRAYWGLKIGDIGIVLNDNYGPKATHKRVYFSCCKRKKVINIKKEDLEIINEPYKRR